MNIASILRHWFTLAATSASLWLIATLVLTDEEAKTLTAEMGKLIEPLVVIVVLLITAFWRVALTWLSTIFRRGAGENGDGKGNAAGVLLLLLVCTATVLGGLSSCSPGMPVDIGIRGPGFQGSYSAKGGLRVDAVIPEK